jgi:hypothetical protein
MMKKMGGDFGMMNPFRGFDDIENQLLGFSDSNK